jgi:hypothetical protein
MSIIIINIKRTLPLESIDECDQDVLEQPNNGDNDKNIMIF